MKYGNDCRQGARKGRKCKAMASKDRSGREEVIESAEMENPAKTTNKKIERLRQNYRKHVPSRYERPRKEC